MRKRLTLGSLLALSLATPLAAQPVSSPAGQKPAAGTTRPAAGSTAPLDTNRFLRTFQADVTRGCLATAARTIRNPAGYCSCYANAFLRRYPPQDLIEINRVSGESPQYPRLIALMMAPEIRACRQANP
jgi:hypothetical protein